MRPLRHLSLNSSASESHHRLPARRASSSALAYSRDVKFVLISRRSQARQKRPAFQKRQTRWCLTNSWSAACHRMPAALAASTGERGGAEGVTLDTTQPFALSAEEIHLALVLGC
jgi:hypothetical protein